MLLLTMLALVSMATGAPTPPQYIDLSYTFDNTTIYWPGVPRFVHELVFAGQKPFGYYTIYNIAASEHGGTHIDAPIHFAANTWSMEEMPLSSLIGDAVVVNFTAEAAKNRDAQLMPSHLEDWERTNGRIPNDAILLLYTGWGQYWPDAKRYLGTATTNKSLLHFPGMHPSAAQWLVDNRKIKLFGLDTASFDYGQSTEYKTHQILLKKNIPGLENVANLDKLPTKGSVVYAAAMKIRKGSGGPCRVFATIKRDAKEATRSGVEMLHRSVVSMVFVLFVICTAMV